MIKKRQLPFLLLKLSLVIIFSQDITAIAYSKAREIINTPYFTHDTLYHESALISTLGLTLNDWLSKKDSQIALEREGNMLTVGQARELMREMLVYTQIVYQALQHNEAIKSSLKEIKPLIDSLEQAIIYGNDLNSLDYSGIFNKILDFFHQIPSQEWPYILSRFEKSIYPALKMIERDPNRPQQIDSFNKEDVEDSFTRYENQLQGPVLEKNRKN